MQKTIKFYTLLLICLGFYDSLAQTKSCPTILNADYRVPEDDLEDLKLDPSINIFKYIFYYEKEEMVSGFKEIKRFFPNFELMKKLKGEQIYFNPTIIVGNNISGMYRNASLKSEFVLNAIQYKPNVFTVVNVNIDQQNNDIKYLELKKIYEDGTPTLYFSPKDFAVKSQSKYGSLADLGLVSMSYLEFLKGKFKDKKYLIKYHAGSDINIPESADLPNSHLMKERQKQNSNRIGTNAMVAMALVDYRYAIWSFLAITTMQDNYKKLQNQMKEFREKQRKLLYNFDITTSKKLKEDSFGEDERWQVVDVKILEDSSTPVLVMENSKKQRILVFEELSDLLIEEGQIGELKSKYGNDILKKLFKGEYDYGMPINLVRFANGYENYLASIEVDASETRETYCYRNQWLYFKNGAFIKHEWRHLVEPNNNKK
jgi:hypothetical protein